ncbi:MAG: PP2C family protein-serine/threonine phosphatase [Bacilli bacterium]
MSACIDKGILRKNQEDAVLILHHPLNDNFKLLAVADGMGGLENGSAASNLALFELIRWFEEIPIQYFISESKIYSEISDILNKIDLIIREKCYNGGTTLSLAIVSQKNTLLLNVGDSRIYILNREIFKQISIDHSISWELYLEKKILHKDDIRFHRKNHLITSRLGCENKMLIIDKQIIQNIDYEEIFLFSDGVTDCLSDLQLQNIINTNNKYYIAEEIVNQALVTDSRSNNLDLDEYYDMIQGGKDNTTVATLVKKI